MIGLWVSSGFPGDHTKYHNTSDGRNGGGVAHKAQMPFHTRVLEPSRLFGETHVVGYPGTAGSCMLHEWMLDGFSEHLTLGERMWKHNDHMLDMR